MSGGHPSGNVLLCFYFSRNKPTLIHMGFKPRCPDVMRDLIKHKGTYLTASLIIRRSLGDEDTFNASTTTDEETNHTDYRYLMSLHVFCLESRPFEKCILNVLEILVRISNLSSQKLVSQIEIILYCQRWRSCSKWQSQHGTG